MSEDAKEKWLAKVSGMKDAETLLKRDAEKLIYDAAVALGKAQMRAQAKDVAEKFQEAGLETYGDLRNADAACFQGDCGNLTPLRCTRWWLKQCRRNRS